MSVGYFTVLRGASGIGADHVTMLLSIFQRTGQLCGKGPPVPAEAEEPGVAQQSPSCLIPTLLELEEIKTLNFFTLFTYFCV